MKKPNFFIIGAPKCGTTALSKWIGLHPKVYMSRIKEPNFFSSDINVLNRIGVDDYYGLFGDVEDEIYIGEASTRYLYSEVACSKILSSCPDAKFVAIVRNPVDMIYSLHNHLLYLGVEPIKNFEDAFRVCDDRLVGQDILVGCNDPDSLSYKRIGLLGEQIERFFSNVPPSQRLVLCFDDLETDPESVYRKLLDFLRVGYEEKINFEPVNKSMAHRSVWLNKLVSYIAEIKRVSGIKRSYGLLSHAQKFNRVDRERLSLSKKIRREVVEYFYQDIKRLESCLQRDFSRWYSNEIRDKGL